VASGSLRPPSPFRGEAAGWSAPLRSLSREETADFCAAWELPVLDRFEQRQPPASAANRIRHDVMPVLEALHRAPAAAGSVPLPERLEASTRARNYWAWPWCRAGSSRGPRSLCRNPLQRRFSPACQGVAAGAIAWRQETGRSPASPKRCWSSAAGLRSSCEPGSLNLGGGWRLAWQGAQHFGFLGSHSR